VEKENQEAPRSIDDEKEMPIETTKTKKTSRELASQPKRRRTKTTGHADEV
jgi:hypothetical protein